MENRDDVGSLASAALRFLGLRTGDGHARWVGTDERTARAVTMEPVSITSLQGWERIPDQVPEFLSHLLCQMACLGFS